MKSRLYTLLEKFTEEGLSKEERQRISESDNKEDLQSKEPKGYIPQVFKDIATNIVNGYFLVSDKNNKNSVKVFPTCVE